MPEENRVIDTIIGAAGNAQRFHQGSHPQGGIPEELSEDEEASLKLHQSSIHAAESKPRWGTDEDGNPIEAGPQGLICTDPLTGTVEPLTEESAERAERNQKIRAEQAEARFKAGAIGASPPPLPEPSGRSQRAARTSPKEDEPPEDVGAADVPAAERTRKPEPRTAGTRTPTS